MSKFTRFTGRFRDLPSHGFTFHKLFARNYKAYRKDDVLIYVKDRSFEIDRLSPVAQDAVIQAVVDGTYPLREKDLVVFGGYVLGKAGEPLGCIINTKTGLITERLAWKRSYGGIDADLTRDDKLHRDFILTYNTMLLIAKWHQAGLIERRCL